MTLNRVTHRSTSERAYQALQMGKAKLAETQNRLTSGRVLTRPSDSPTDTTSAMKLRAALSEQTQYGRNAEDGLGWLGQIDTTLTSTLGQVRRARELGVQGLNAVNQGPQAREALAAEVDALRDTLLSAANTTYLGRPVFGGPTTGSTAYDAGGAWVGTPGQVTRSIDAGVKVAVDVPGPEVFGPDGDNLFDRLASLADDLRSGNVAGVQAGITSLDTAVQRVTTTLAQVGSRYGAVDRAVQSAKDRSVTLTASLSSLEDVDVAKASIDLSLREVAYQSALAATARLVQPSLSDFLR